MKKIEKRLEELEKIIKQLAYRISDGDPEMVEKLGIIGALELYLDFINIFLYLLRIFSKRRN